MRLGTPSIGFMSRLLCGLILLTPSALSIGIRGLAAPNADDVADMAGNEASDALHAGGTIMDQTEDTGRLVETEHKKLTAHLNTKAKSLLPASLAGSDGSTDYLIASFPEFRVVNYVRLPDLVWRPLIVTGLANPRSVVVDEDRARVYIADPGLCKIVWYQLISLPDGTLISDGRQHVAVQAVNVRSLALDLTGSLWFSAVSTPTPPIPSIDAIWKQPLLTIDQTAASGTPLEPLPQWTKAATSSNPSPLVLDAFNIYFGNEMEGKTKGSVVKASQSVPLANPSSGISPMADNADVVYSVAVTPNALFYGADGAIYGVQKNKVGASCGATGDLCKVITDLVKKPTAMLWNGDGTVFVADNGAGAIYSFASGSVSPHALDKIIDAGEVYGLDILKVVRNQGEEEKSSATSMAPTLVLFLVSAVIAMFQ